jgi:hypothetical protein
MTKLTKPIERETNKRYGNRAVIVTLAPAGSQNEALIGLRLKGTRTTYVIALSDVYRYAALQYGYKASIAKRKARKDGIPWRQAKKDFIKTNLI